ncbi:MAG: AbrB/MazE/SpoVT family DNA-binding domain-containing protein [Nitrospirota bacterium]
MAPGGNPPIDPKMVAMEVQKGKSLEEIQRIFGIKMKSQVQDLYVRGLRQLGEIPHTNLPKTPERPSERLLDTGYRRSIGQSGSITLTRALLLEKLGFEEGDTFQILRQGDDLILRKVE